MCGIAGVIERDVHRAPSRERLYRMARALRHRGPDEAGFYQSGPVGFAHQRLSIIDLAAGQQPMEDPHHEVCVIFNGEIYNYQELKKELEQHGREFRTRSDTEVLLALYLRHGLAAFAKINGMFACAFWDTRTRQLILARDRWGKKPLFYYQDAERFLFGSEIKALLAHGGIERKVNVAALHQYLTFGYVPGEQTMLEGIYRLPPAHLLVLRNGHARRAPYWRLEFCPREYPPAETEAVEQLAELLRQAVKRRLMSDVPLGAFLSGGLDSSVVVALMAQLTGRRVQTFTIGFEESAYSELEEARTVARHLGTEHHEMMVKPATVEVLPHLVWHLDEPLGDSSALPTYYVSHAARQHVTVALSGDGGDETFAGYNLYQQVAYYQRLEWAPTWLRRAVVKPLTHVLPFTWPGWNYLHALGRWKNDGLPCELGVYPWIQERLLTAGFQEQLHGSDPLLPTRHLLAQGKHLDPISRYQYFDTVQYLPGDILAKVDRMSMAHSLEVRSPLLDHTVVEYMATLPASLKLRHGAGKYLLRKFAARLLPPSILAKRKQGFAIPQGRWFQHELRTFAEELLLAPRTLARGYFRPDAVGRILRHHAAGRRDYSTWIWSLVVLEMWFRLFLDAPGTGRTNPVQPDEDAWASPSQYDRLCT